MNSTQQPYALLYLWQLRTLYIGELFELRSMHTAASCMVMSRDKPFHIEDARSGKSAMTSSALVPADALVRVISDGQIMACCFLDPFGQDFRALQNDMDDCLGLVHINSRREQQQVKSFELLYRDRVPAVNAYQTLMQEILPPQQGDSNSIDPRLQQAVHLIKQDPLSNQSNQWLAEQVGMSESQLQRMFRQILGVPVRRYRLWHRLFVTAGLMATGTNLTDAALASGFADSSHFSRTFRSMLGMTPSFVFQRHSRLVIETGGDESGG